MHIIKRFKEVIIILVVTVGLVLLRITGNHFRPDAEKWARPAFDGSNIVSGEQVSELPGEKYIISLDEPERFRNLPNAVSISPASILEKSHLRRIRRNKGPVILYSKDLSVSSGSWMVLSQMGIRDLYILTEERDNEALKYDDSAQ